MECMMAYCGNNLINMVVSKTYTTKRNQFKGSGTRSGIAYTFDVTEVPIAKLFPGNRNRNIEIDLKVAIAARGDIVDFSGNVAMKATGKIAIRNSVLSITQLRVTANSTNNIDNVVVSIINTQIIPIINTAISGITIPQLTNLFGSGLSARLFSGKVISGSALEVGARITGKPRIAPANAPTSANISSLNNGTSSNALTIAMVSGGAVNELIKAMIPSLSHAFDKRASKFRFGAGIKGTIRSTTPVLNITNGKGNARTTISFHRFQGGIRVPLKGWTWVTLPAPNTNVVITHTLTSLSKTGLITLTGVASIKVSFSWPSVLKPVENLIKGLLNGILRLFRGLISNAVKGRKFELFKLPNTIPGTGFGATLGFNSDGLGYFSSSVRAIIRIKV